ncbi:hypothetical protein COCVIDRAFT_106646 [Bipolaris victoriae FI3]|uniref:Uncharacterized protein n=1 Tax=Bipolaris victoriae (strain FI3) TaxID=930091 RepID=W7EEE8_BIPV3|nr:hypothetical protein COCVIDRAFT_106646 [Bipolaris victoriae FI3]
MVEGGRTALELGFKWLAPSVCLSVASTTPVFTVEIDMHTPTPSWTATRLSRR